MHTISLKYLGQLRTEAQHLSSSNLITTDAPTDNQGKGESFSPTDLTCSSLASCMMTIMGIKAVGLGVDLRGLEATVTKIMASSPRKISAIKINFSLAGSQLTVEEKRVLKEAALTCPVALSLNPDIRQEIRLSW